MEIHRHFENVIHKNNSLSKVEKLIYLKNLVGSSAASAIKGLELKDENYNSALEILQSRYVGAEHILSTNHSTLERGHREAYYRHHFQHPTRVRSIIQTLHNNNKTYIDSDLKSLFKQLNRARKIWQFTRDPNDKTILNRLQDKINRKVNALTQKQWEDKLTSLDPEDGFLWNMAKGFRKKRSPISDLTGPTGIAYTDTQKAERLANSLENQFQLNDIQNPD
ncbi:hypothetical protein TNCV_1543301 [Trichonephila clavipes]|nr:hypothetical protein TNCV_1543301 [Trichonephila clavipes]